MGINNIGKQKMRQQINELELAELSDNALDLLGAWYKEKYDESLPLLTVGQMIDFLNDHDPEHRFFTAQLDIYVQHDMENLVPYLWDDCVEILEREDASE